MKLRQLHVKMGLCSLNNDPLDFKNNYRKIYQSIEECKRLNCSIRVGGELQVSGYSCEDHYLEYDTIFHSWDVIKDLIVSGVSNGIVVDVGCPILHKAALYNGRVIIHNSKVVAVRCQMINADGDDNFQTRYFSAWRHPRKIDDFMLPQMVQQVTHQHTVPIGCFIIGFNDTSLAYQMGQQASISDNPMIDAALDGAQIFVNPSASTSERGRQKRKIQMFEEFTERHGGAYAHANIKGNIGQRNIHDGMCCFTQNGKLREMSQPFDLGDVQVTPITININSVRTFRINNKSFQKESHGVALIPRVRIPISIANNQEEYIYDNNDHRQALKRKRNVFEFQHASYEPSVFLWDVLRKSQARGFFLPLNGGLDSCAVGLMVFNMCNLFSNQIKNKSQSDELLSKLRRVLKDKKYTFTSAKDLCNRILFTAHLATQQSSEQTKKRSSELAQAFGSNHRNVNLDEIYQCCSKIALKNYGVEPKHLKDGGSQRTDTALQNIQARSRMVLSYFLAALQPQKRGLDGFLLVLGSTNLDESLNGQYTKYDNSSCDVNPIGSFSKLRLRQIVNYFYRVYDFPALKQVINATPTAQLPPLKEGQIAENNEQDMPLTYAQLCQFGRLRKVERLGPVSMFDRMVCKQCYDSPQIIAAKIKRFFTHYSQNRHKAMTLPPTFIYDPECCDNNRFDIRPFMYATDWSYQFGIIDQRVRQLKSQDVFKKGSLSKLAPSKMFGEEASFKNMLPPSQEKSEIIINIFNP